MQIGQIGREEVERREIYGPDRDRPKDLPHLDLAWNHPRNVEADISRGARAYSLSHFESSTYSSGVQSI
ncbi:MAG: hypothetical protein ACP5NS_03160 [Candidatus Pacearchaeota archaeon]